MNSYAERLAWAMKCHGLSPSSDQSTLAKLVGAPCKPQNIQHLLAGTAKSSKYTPRIALVLECDALWLAEGVGKKPEPHRDASHLGIEVGEETSNHTPKGVSEHAKSLENSDNLGGNPSGDPDWSVKVSSGHIEQFVTDLKTAWKSGRLTSRRFALLRELLQEGTESQPAVTEMTIATRGGDGRPHGIKQRTGTKQRRVHE